MNQAFSDGHSFAVMRAILKRWGAICEVSRGWNGYPTSDTTYRATFGRGGGGKRLPIPNIPTFAVQLSDAVMKLPDNEGNAITIWYAHHFNFEGRWLSGDEKARLLGIGFKALKYRERVGRGMLIVRAPHVIDSFQRWADERDACIVGTASA